eukprot:TRINITY_DN17725_c0_g1_i2.p1 TRINITY_DN17725_c0_g1~~TRINITY_DN17725_c0_g1_i2.p1  ORF type:complete len:869 (+),score=180.14 TRINITY_DN17725_c0_g1_i2:81-2687(+)
MTEKEVGVIGGLTAGLQSSLKLAGAERVIEIDDEKNKDVSKITHLIVTKMVTDPELKEIVQKRIADASMPTLVLGMDILRDMVPTIGVEIVDITPNQHSHKWLSLESDTRCKFVKSGDAYFTSASKKCFRAIPLGWVASWTTATCNSIIASLENGPICALQLQPELSSTFGRTILSRWLKYSPLADTVTDKDKTIHISSLVSVSQEGASVGTSDIIPAANIASCDLPAAWEACGSDTIVVLGDADSERNVTLIGEACTSKCAIPVLTQVHSLESAEAQLNSGISRVIVDISDEASQTVIQGLDNRSLLCLLSVTVTSAGWKIGDKDPISIHHVKQVLEAAPSGCGIMLFMSCDSNTDSNIVADDINALCQSHEEVWVSTQTMPVAMMISLAEKCSASNFVRFPLEGGAPPAKVKGSLLTSKINTRVHPSGMQYGSTNLQCVIPSLAVTNGLVDGKNVIKSVEDHSVVGEVAVIDVDASIGLNSGTREIMKSLFKKHHIRFGGGIKKVEDAQTILNDGAAKVIIGSMASREFLSALPRERVVVAIDAIFHPGSDNEVGVWKTSQGNPISKVISDLCDTAGHFQVTFAEPQSPGLDLALVMKLVAVCKASKATLTVAGPINTEQEIAVLDEMGIECLIPSNILTGVDNEGIEKGKLPLSAAITSIIKTDRIDGLYPTVVVDSNNGRALGMCYSNIKSIQEAVRRKRGIYWSRTRGLWVKGESSGDVQQLVSITTDCDRDCLMFTVKQSGSGFCHRHQQSCFGPATGFDKLIQTLQQRKAAAPAGSYTKRLFEDPALLKAKLLEEATELIESPNADNCAFEAADVIYFALVRCVIMGVDLLDIQRCLDWKSNKIHRRPGNAKPQFEQKKPE